MLARHRSHRHGLHALLVILVAVTASVLTPATAAAAVVVLNCTGQSNTTYDPPITNNPQSVVVTSEGKLGATGNPGTCGYVGPLPAVTSATYDDSANIPNATCTSLSNLALPGTRVLTWNGGQTSTFSYTTTITGVNGTYTVVRTGAITAGRFNGAFAQQTGVVPQLDLTACAGDGVPGAATYNALTIIG